MSNKDCIFCKIVNKEIPSSLIIETDDYIAFKDIDPKAPVHALVIPKTHYASLNDIKNVEVMGKLLKGVQETVEKLGVKENYRTVINTGADAGQAVFHIHIHVLAGRPLSWPPG